MSLPCTKLLEIKNWKFINHKAMAKITVNGEVQEVQLPLTLTQLITQNNVLQPEMVSVQVNEDFADRSEWDAIQIQEGDSVDFLYFMGGGCHGFDQ